jgi:hypothetical protein
MRAGTASLRKPTSKLEHIPLKPLYVAKPNWKGRSETSAGDKDSEPDPKR